jgi:tetratricopeptide (TPR) repeat protein
MLYFEEVHEGDDVPTEHEGHEVENLGTLFNGDAPSTGDMPVTTLTAEDVARYAAEKAAAATRMEAVQASEAAKARGNAAFAAKRYSEALKAYSEAIELDGSNALVFGAPATVPCNRCTASRSPAIGLP